MDSLSLPQNQEMSFLPPSRRNPGGGAVKDCCGPTRKMIGVGIVVSLIALFAHWIYQRSTDFSSLGDERKMILLWDICIFILAISLPVGACIYQLYHARDLWTRWNQNLLVSTRIFTLWPIIGPSIVTLIGLWYSTPNLLEDYLPDEKKVLVEWGSNLFGQGIFLLSNFIFYRFYDNAYSDTVSLTFISDKYGPSISYLISQLIVFGWKIRNYCILYISSEGLIQHEALVHLISVFISQLIKAMIVNGIFQHHTRKDAEQRSENNFWDDRATHYCWVIVLILTEFIIRLGLKHGSLDSFHFIGIWFLLFGLVQTCKPENNKQFNESAQYPLFNLSWLFEIFALSATIC